jgi:hypothetical protein
MGGKTKKAKKQLTKLRHRSREKQLWRTEFLNAARTALEYRFEDLREISGINEKVIAKIMRGDYNATYRSLESVVTSLYLEMFEIFNPEATIAEVVKNVYDRANLKREVRQINGAVVAIKPDDTMIVISGKLGRHKARSHTV